MPIAIPHRQVLGRTTLGPATLLSAVVATGNGEWVQVAGYTPITVSAEGITTATVDVRGSLAPVKPADATHGFALGSFTTDGALVIENPCEWIKVRVSAYTSGTITAYMLGSEAD
jgi:hypothetical protein